MLKLKAQNCVKRKPKLSIFIREVTNITWIKDCWDGIRGFRNRVREENIQPVKNSKKGMDDRGDVEQNGPKKAYEEI